MLERLKQRTRDVRTIHRLNTRADEIANAMGEEKVGAEHLLLSAFELPDGTARRAFEMIGADPDGYRSAIDEQYNEALRGIGIEPASISGLAEAAVPVAPNNRIKDGQPSAQRVFQEISRDAPFLGPERLIGAKIVAAVASMEDGVAVRALRTMEIDRGALQSAADELAERSRIG